MVVNGITIGKYIYSKLSDLCDGRVYPIVAENGSNFPFILYDRTGVSQENNKDGFFSENVFFDVTVATQGYEEGITLSDTIRKRLTIIKDDVSKIYNMQMTNINESFGENTYIQTMSFQARVQK